MRKDLDTGGMAAEIVATCRTMLETGLVVGTWGNVSRRCGRGCLLITPSGIPYPALEAEDLVAVGSNGKPAPGESGRRHPSTETLLHAEIYRAREAPGAMSDVSAAQLAERVSALGRPVLTVYGAEEIVERVYAELAPGDVLITMGAGDIRKVSDAFVERLRTYRAAG